MLQTKMESSTVKVRIAMTSTELLSQRKIIPFRPSIAIKIYCCMFNNYVNFHFIFTTFQKQRKNCGNIAVASSSMNISILNL